MFPERFPFFKSLSPRRAAATNCLKKSSLEKVFCILAGLKRSSNGDSRTISFLFPCTSVGSIIVFIVCSGVSNP